MADQTGPSGSTPPSLDPRWNIFLDKLPQFEKLFKMVDNFEKEEAARKNGEEEAKSGEANPMPSRKGKEKETRPPLRDDDSSDSSKAEEITPKEDHKRRSECRGGAPGKDGEPEHTASSLHLGPVGGAPNRDLEEKLDLLLGKGKARKEWDPTSHPFPEHIRNAPWPKHVRGIPDVGKYDGKGDPEEHIVSCLDTCHMLRLSDANSCLLLAHSLKDAARRWYCKLPRSSVYCFKQFADLFCKNFECNKVTLKPPSHLFTLKQGEHESLRKFRDRFNLAKEEVYEKDDSLLVYAFINAVLPGEFNRSLHTDHPRSFAEIMQRCSKQIAADEADRDKSATFYPRHKREEGSKRFDKGKGAEERKSGGLDRLRALVRQTSFSSGRAGRPESTAAQEFTPLNASRAEIMMIGRAQGIIKPPRKLFTPDHQRDTRKFCAHHDTHGHNTEDCFDLKMEIERAIKKGELKDFIAKTGGPRKETAARKEDRGRDRDRGHDRSLNKKPRNSSPDGGDHVNVYTICGGHTSGDSNQERKKRARTADLPSVSTRNSWERVPISFEPQDFPSGQNADDPLVITAWISKYCIHRTLIDNGSSVNIIYENVFEACKMKKEDLQKVRTPVIGLADAVVYPLGKVVIPLTLKEGEKGRTVDVEFVVLKGTSAYNMFLGRPGLNAFGAVPSTVHQMIKFPTPEGIVSVRGDTKVARECYMVAVKSGLKMKKQCLTVGAEGRNLQLGVAEVFAREAEDSPHELE